MNSNTLWAAQIYTLLNYAHLMFRLAMSVSLFWSLGAAAQNQAVIGEVRSPDATIRGAVVVGNQSTSVMSGSQVAAGSSNARIELKRGGELQVCKKSDITLTSASNGREMLVALNTGTLEVHYNLASTTDTVITPDFRLSLTGPGVFHVAIGAQANGGMCVKSLASNVSSVIVNEQFGDGAHQVKPGEQITFHNGHVDDFSASAADCGCPVTPTAVVSPAPAETNPTLKFPEEQSKQAAQVVAAGGEPPRSEGIPVAAAQQPNRGQTYTQIDAPMVFRAEEVPPAPSTARNTLPAAPPAVVLKALPPSPEKKAWYQRWGGAISSFFGGKSQRK